MKRGEEEVIGSNRRSTRLREEKGAKGKGERRGQISFNPGQGHPLRTVDGEEWRWEKRGEVGKRKKRKRKEKKEEMDGQERLTTTIERKIGGALGGLGK